MGYKPETKVNKQENIPLLPKNKRNNAGDFRICFYTTKNNQHNMSIIMQILLLFALIIGTIIGEALATKAFGEPKKAGLWIIEIVTFVIILVLVTNQIYLYQEDHNTLLALNCLVGLIAAISGRAVSTVTGKMGILPGIVLSGGKTREEKLAVNTVKHLKQKKTPDKAIRELLQKSGYNKKEIDLALSSTRRIN